MNGRAGGEALVQVQLRRQWASRPPPAACAGEARRGALFGQMGCGVKRRGGGCDAHRGTSTNSSFVAQMEAGSILLLEGAWRVGVAQIKPAETVMVAGPRRVH